MFYVAGVVSSTQSIFDLTARVVLFVAVKIDTDADFVVHLVIHVEYCEKISELLEDH